MGLKIVLAPGNGCSDITDSLWYSWVMRQLQGLVLKTILKDFPDPLYARETNWIPFLRDDLGCDADTVLIGHSSGAAAAMRLAENVRLKGIVLVSAYHSDLGDSIEKASGYFGRPWQWERIRANCGFVVQFHSKDDHLVPVEEANIVQRHLQSEYHLMDDMGHFQDDEFPELVEVIKSKLGL